VKTIDRCREMEEACRRHAELDKTTATHWLEKADVWSKLMKVEHRLQLLGVVRRPRSAKSNPAKKNETSAECP
jgi:hypothetical protein